MASGNKKSKLWWFLGAAAVTFAIVMFILAGALILKFMPEMKAYSPVGKKIGVVDIKGTIAESEGIINILHDYRDDPNISCIVLYIDSPGGAVAPTQEIYDEILALKKTHRKKVYAYISNLGASGGYYVACGADKIYANPGALTGSIGVIINFLNVEGLFGKLGVSSKTVKSGRYKDIGSPFRPMSPEEEALLGATVDDVYQQFLDAVVTGRRAAVTRKLIAGGEKTPTQYRVRRYIMGYADGRIFSGRQARDLGFVDEIGNFQKCLKEAAKEAGIEGEPTVVRKKLKEPTLGEALFGFFKGKWAGWESPPTTVQIKYSMY